MSQAILDEAPWSIRRIDVVSGVLLVASVITNIVLCRTSDVPHPVNDSRPENASAQPHARSHTWPSATPECESQLTAIENELRVIEGEIEARLTLDDKFDRGTPSPSNERRIREVFAKVFGDECSDDTCVVHCRGAICKIEIDNTAPGTPRDFVQRFGEGSSGMFGTKRHSTRNERDAISGKRVQLSEITVELAGEPEVTGRQLLVDVSSAFLGSPEVASCKRRHPERGHVIYHLGVDIARARIVVREAGNLATKPIAKCLRTVLDSLVANRPVPPNAITIPNFYFHVAVP